MINLDGPRFTKEFVYNLLHLHLQHMMINHATLTCCSSFNYSLDLKSTLDFKYVSSIKLCL